MGLKEILAAKKAAAEAAANQKSTAPTTEQPAPSMIAAVEEPIKEESAKPAEPDKPLSFAEKMALRKAEVQSAQKAPPKPLQIDPSELPADPAEAQAYVDIKTRIHALENSMDDDLRNAMAELKQALKKNPNACELLLDSDIGKMVVALRRMTHVEVTIAKEPKKPGRKSSPKATEVKLTAEEVAAAFDEL